MERKITMLIAKAYAQAEKVAGEIGAAVPGAPSAGEAFAWNMGMVLVLVALFYLLLIRPQQRRFKEHKDMLSKLKKGDRVVTGGGLVGKIDKIQPDSEEIIVDLGSGVKVTALRSTITGQDDPLLRQKPANDESKKKKAKK